MEESPSGVSDQQPALVVTRQVVLKRKTVLPAWIRFFAWLYLIGGSLVLPIWLMSFLSAVEVNLKAWGVGFNGPDVHSFHGTWTAATMVLAGVVAYMILWGKNHAPVVGAVYGFVALGTTAFNCALILIRTESLYVTLEPLLLVPFIFLLLERKARWDKWPELEEVEGKAQIRKES